RLLELAARPAGRPRRRVVGRLGVHGADPGRPARPRSPSLMELRPARVDDLGQIYDVWYETEVVGLADPPPPRTMPWFGHLLSVGQLTVAVDGGVIVGFAGVLDYGRCVALSGLFVGPSWQSQGVGGGLLDGALAAGRAAVTMASGGPRAVASYVRRGLLPRWPAYYIAASPEQLRDFDPVTA